MPRHGRGTKYMARSRSRSGRGGRSGGANGAGNGRNGGEAHKKAHERYLNLARSAASDGDRIAAENYLQHADHHLRMMRDGAA